MDKGKIKLLIKSGFFALILLIFAYPSYSQNDTGKTYLDTLDDEQDLFDENTDYKEMYKDLNKDGEWVTIKKSDIDKDSTESDGATTNITINVWRPYGMVSDWTPYSYGNWVYTYSGWMWITDFAWGWATYHYGRWYYDYYWGWVWLPGRYWAPNWVQWCYNSSYIGWYPIYPRRHGWHHGHHNWHHGRYYTHTDPRHWVIVKRKDFTEIIKPSITVDKNENGRILEESKKKAIVKFDGKSYTNIGPKVDVIEKNTGAKIEPKKVTLNESKGITKVDESTVKLYRNDVEKKTEYTGSKENVNTNNGSKEKVNKNEGRKEGSTENGSRAPNNNERQKEKVTKTKERSTENNRPPSNEGRKEQPPESKSKSPGYEQKRESPPPNRESSPNRDNGSRGSNNNGSKSNDSGRGHESSKTRK